MKTSRPSWPVVVFGLLAVGSFASAARARTGDETLRISNAPGGASGNSGSYFASISRDGKVIAFASTASDLVAGDTNGVADVFVFDRTTGLLERVSVATDGTQSDGASNLPVLSGEGRYVVFDSYASNLEANDGGSRLDRDVFLHDRVTAMTHRVSSNASGDGASGESTNPTITPDGRFVVYASNASDLAAGDTNGKYDIFRFDVRTGATLRVSTTSAGAQANGDCGLPFVSDEGNVVAFSSSATNFPNAHYSSAFAVNAFRKSLATGVLERVDVNWKGSYPFANSLAYGISADGESISFQSEAPYLPDDTNGDTDGYVRDLAAGIMERLTVRTGGSQLDGPAGGVELTPDARYAMFWTLEDDVVPGDDNGHTDLFLRDRRTGITSILTTGTFDEAGDADNSSFGRVALSGDGKHFVFHSHSTTFAPDDHNHAEDVFLRIRGTTDASWTRYGEGFRGRLGLPSIALSTPLWRGATVELQIGNSAGDTTLALILIGTGRVDLPTSLGGHLLVLPITTVPCLIDVAGGVCPMEVPTGWQFAGATFDLQALELDPGAAHGVSFTRGLEAVLGD